MNTDPGRLADLAALGPYFAVNHHPAGMVVRSPWRTFEALVTDPDVLRERVGAIRHGLAAMGGLPDDAVEQRVAASVTQLGVAARLLSPALAAAVGSGIVLDLAPGETWWQPVPGGPIPVSISLPQPVNPVPDPADLLAERVFGGPIRALVEAFAHMSVSRRILWGNVASAVHGAATMLDRARPEWTVRTRALTAALRERKPLAGTGNVDAHGRFRRHSCCLIYRAAPDRSGPVCGDCVLAPERS
ncbi:(2Fe-2S)-binding protein [Amycolatopsis sp. GM8]|uniref:(2Fe-2S)-binding protein n=1 Tax=Amycolatopsis sp. GM8 TaxID=2896530 RepID=UPI001F013344|nr:(2Fe-2S)-binding protein [Amycolatopsis sp. GM8]